MGFNSGLKELIRGGKPKIACVYNEQAWNRFVRQRKDKCLHYKDQSIYDCRKNSPVSSAKEMNNLYEPGVCLI
jgi:hypothetical protein